MRDVPELPLTLVPWPAWAPWMAHALRPLRPRERRLAREILRFLHDRHVGIPPAFAADLARRLVAPVRCGGPWEPIVRRLGRELASGGPLSPAAHGAALLAAAPPFHVTARIALPVLADAAAQLGERFLFTRATDGTPPEAGRYASHEQRLAERIAQAAAARGQRADELWIERATTLRELVGGRAPSSCVEVGGLAKATSHRIAGTLRTPRPRGRAAPAPGSASTRRSRLRVPDGGVEDVALSRSPDDLPRMLMSAWLEPELLRTLRLMQGTGVPVLDRPPLREQPRDVLLLGVLPVLPPAPLARVLVKAAWLDTMILALAVLKQRGLERSEIRWIEDDGLGGCRRFGASLAEIRAALPSPDTLAASASLRERLLDTLGWIPALFDRHAVPRGDPLEAASTAAPWEWTRAAWRARDAGTHAALGDFRAVHAIACVPGALPESDAVVASGLRRALGFERLPNAHLTLTRVPERLDDVAGWGRALAGREPPSDRPLEAWLAERIEGSWLEDLAAVLS